MTPDCQVILLSGTRTHAVSDGWEMVIDQQSTADSLSGLATRVGRVWELTTRKGRIHRFSAWCTDGHPLTSMHVERLMPRLPVRRTCIGNV